MDIVKKALPYLKPCVHDATTTICLAPDEQPVVRMFDEDLMVMYVVDIGNALQIVQEHDLKKEHVTEAELHSSSIQNLKRLADAALRIESHDPVFMVFLEGNLEASLLLLDDLWENRLRHLVQRGFIAAIPARDVLVFCDCDSQEGIRQLHQVVDRLQNGDHLITTALFRREGGLWTRYTN